MIRFDERTGYLHATDLGRTASQFYINHETIEVFNEMMKPVMKEDEILDIVAQVVRAVNHIHDLQVLHRDIKLSNLF